MLRKLLNMLRRTLLFVCLFVEMAPSIGCTLKICAAISNTPISILNAIQICFSKCDFYRAFILIFLYYVVSNSTEIQLNENKMFTDKPRPNLLRIAAVQLLLVSQAFKFELLLSVDVTSYTCKA